jgi:hypothetical protein
LALKVNPAKQPADIAPVTEVQTKPAAETKVKSRKKDAQVSDLSLEKHHATPSLNDVNNFCFVGILFF